MCRKRSKKLAEKSEKIAVEWDIHTLLIEEINYKPSKLKVFEAKFIESIMMRNRLDV